VRLAALIALAALAVVAASVGLALALGLGHGLRSWFGFGFRHPRDVGYFAGIALENARVACLPIAAALALPALGRARFACDVAIALVAALNCTLVGLALAAYGGRLAASLAAHGPLELGAMSLALAVYVRARTTCPRRPLGLLRSVAGCAVLILSAAALEVWVS
jgi:hypothetical protein